MGFLSRREFFSLYNPRSELHPLLFNDQFSHDIYHSTYYFCPVHYTAMVNIFFNRLTGYKQSEHTSTRRNLTDRLYI
jgi:hypothetical protein